MNPTRRLNSIAVRYLAEAGGVEELPQVGDWILDCGSGRELLDRFRRPRDT